MVPEGWNRKAIGEVAEIKVGRDLKEDHFSEQMTPTHIYPVFSNTVDGRGLYGYYDFAEYPGNSVTVVGRGIGLGTAFSRAENEGFGAIGRLLVLSPKENSFSIGFLENFINFRLRIHNESGGIPQLPGTTLAKYLVDLPPLPEQKKIAQILSTWDQAITATERLLENSQQRKKGLMQQLLTGKKRLPGFEGEWEDVRLKELLTEEKTRNKDLSISRVLSVTNHSGFVLPEDQFSKRVASDNVSNYRVVRKGQYGYNPSRLNVGSFARLDSYDEGLLSPMYVVFSVDETRLNNDYFLNWMKSNEAKQRIAGSTQGSVRDSVGFDALCSFPFRLPPIDEQQEIAKVLMISNQEIDSLKQRISCLQQEKKALMQQLLTGKRRVQVDTEAA